ncbi:nuclear transport factor 2 domain-containing protein [Nannizzia gypsea CBS 118893]|uniref:Nuclear transport factor 2 domain-containing protein n=1 Tax=Arthroderma gypseum (strain ATCC MYA-4604 / CBS 118893) TaxID=535722 RepID=E4UVY3_ARTGP|nr:nuclear transport factor 2 domain-containing protein [Nannizzia gypsea CBS 118893]EFR01644.1 nuclear transport factor 2 domain-containing protein [Nannizzia gypsea CBS 118893]
MTAAIQEDVLTKVSTDATTNFIQSYYSALDNARSTLSSFYAPTVTNILFNGNIVADGASVQEIFVNQLPPTHYEVQSYDCQVLNPNYPVAPPSATDDVASPFGANTNRNTSDPAKSMSILVIVSGYVKFGEGKETWDSPNRGFSETFVLIPNPPSGPKARGKQWLIQSQNFRIVV